MKITQGGTEPRIRITMITWSVWQWSWEVHLVWTWRQDTCEEDTDQTQDTWTWGSYTARADRPGSRWRCWPGSPPSSHPPAEMSLAETVLVRGVLDSVVAPLSLFEILSMFCHNLVRNSIVKLMNSVPQYWINITANFRQINFRKFLIIYWFTSVLLII